MANFVTAHGNTSLGFPKINLDQVVVLEPIKEGGKVESYRALDSHGEDVGTIDRGSVYSSNPVVPNTTSARILACYFDENGDVTEVYYPIIGWEYSNGSFDPLTFELFNHSIWCITYENQYIIPEVESFETKNEFITYAVIENKQNQALKKKA